jgi:hypothetical protein
MQEPRCRILVVRRLVVAILLLSVVGCSPSAPSDGDFSGTWVGPDPTAGYGAGTITATIAQHDLTVTGIWSSVFPLVPTADGGGQLLGKKTGASVTVTLLNAPGNCPYTYNATLLSTTTMSGTLATADCSITFAGTLVLTRQ